MNKKLSILFVLLLAFTLNAFAEEKLKDIADTKPILSVGDSLPEKATQVLSEEITDATNAQTVASDVQAEDKKNIEMKSAVASVQDETAVKPKESAETAHLGGMANKPESQIPVLTSVQAKKTHESNPIAKMFFSLIIIGLLSAGLVYFSKWYSRTYKKTTDNNKIRVLTQHFLGPKKSLAIIRVAGESILIGITDQNISMLKSLALIDDEMPESMPVNFNHSLDQADKIASKNNTNEKFNVSRDDTHEEFLFGNIKDKITNKMKDMRSI